MSESVVASKVSSKKKKEKRKTLSSVKFNVRVLGSQWQHDLLLGGF